MKHIGAGQPAVTANDACPLCGYWTCRCNGFDDTPEFDTLAGQDALRDIVAGLEVEAETDVDTEDLAYYRGLFAAPAVDITRAPVVLAVAA
jgi:hypothetical protein